MLNKFVVAFATIGVVGLGLVGNAAAATYRAGEARHYGGPGAYANGPTRPAFGEVYPWDYGLRDYGYGNSGYQWNYHGNPKLSY